MLVKELMTSHVHTLTPQQTLADATKLFVENGIDGAPIVNAPGELISIITKTDIMRAYLVGTAPETTLESLPNKEVQTIESSINLLEVWNKDVGRLPVIDEAGHLVGMLTRTDLCNGIYHKGLLEELNAARAFSRRLDAIIESSYDGIYITDGRANTLMVNRAYEDITGLGRETLIGHNMLELEERKVVSQSATLIVLKEKHSVTIEQVFQNGNRALVTSTPILDEHDDVMLVVTNVRDITALLKLQDQVAQNKALAEKYYQEIEEMRKQLMDSTSLIAQDEKMLETLRLARRVARVDTTVLIQGETGVGKEEVAKFIHKNSQRHSSVFLKVNCGAIPESLIESELFGYDRGAFTGANKEGKMGLFELSNGGTLFLDEVAELPLDMQVKLLRVLQDQEFTRVGGVHPIQVDVRILAATNQDLESLVSKNLFRKDLFYRLNVVPITILPLRERKEDIFPLINYFITALNNRYDWNKSFAREALRQLYEYPWPGNIRELKNIIERVVVISDHDVITDYDLSQSAQHVFSAAQDAQNKAITPLKVAVKNLELQMIEKAFKQYGNVRDAAKALEIDASTLVRKRQRCHR